MEELLPGKIIFNIDVMLAKRKMSVTELADKDGDHDRQYVHLKKTEKPKR